MDADGIDIGKLKVNIRNISNKYICMQRKMITASETHNFLLNVVKYIQQ